MTPSSAQLSAPEAREQGNAASGLPGLTLDFEGVYADHFAFVWRSVRRLGVPESAAEDVAQEVFVIVHRRLDTYEGRASVRAWLFGIVRGVVTNYRRTQRRARAFADKERAEAEEPVSDWQPEERAEKAEAVRILYAVLAAMDEDKREVFVLAELEQMPASEIAEALGIALNTVSSRLRAARAAFKEAASRMRARDEWRLR
jgi:RNA polymerase sigma-70 factor, ECF subfamily